MANLNGFDANTVEPADDLEPIPAGKYVAVITDSEMKPTKSGTGNYLQLTFQIVEGEYANRLLWVRLNLDNPNATAVEIARRELSAICRSVGVLVPTDSADLHNLPCVIHVRVKRRNDTGELQNEVKGYSKKDAVAQPIAASVASSGSSEVSIRYRPGGRRWAAPAQVQGPLSLFPSSASAGPRGPGTSRTRFPLGSNSLLASQRCRALPCLANQIAKLPASTGRRASVAALRRVTRLWSTAQ